MKTFDLNVPLGNDVWEFDLLTFFMTIEKASQYSDKTQNCKI